MSAQSEYENDIKEKDHTTTFYLFKNDKSQMMKKYFQMASRDPAQKERSDMIEKSIKFVEVISAALMTLSNLIARFFYYHQLCKKKLKTDDFKQLCTECAKVALKGYDELHSNKMSIILPCLLSTLVNTSPIKNDSFLFQLNSIHEKKVNNCIAFFPPGYRTAASFGLSEILYNYRMAITTKMPP